MTELFVIAMCCSLDAVQGCVPKFRLWGNTDPYLELVVGKRASIAMRLL